MESIFETFKNTGVVHHAHLVLGVPEKNRAAMETLLVELLAGPTAGHPDLWELITEQISIDDSRSLREEQSHQPITASRRIFIIQAFGITEPAQHALLKTLEDPNPTSHFFLLFPTLEGLLPTLRSRFMITNGIQAEESEAEFAEEFLRAYPAKRMAMLEKFGLAKLDPEDKKQVRRELEAALRSVESALRVKLRDTEAGDAHRALREIALVKGYLGDPAAALRLLMDHLALVLPVFR